MSGSSEDRKMEPGRTCMRKPCTIARSEPTSSCIRSISVVKFMSCLRLTVSRDAES